MKKEITNMLEAVDDPKNWEHPRYFNLEVSIARVVELKYDLDGIVGRPFEIEDRIFDSSYFAELEIKEAAPIKVFDLGEVTLRIVRLRFSCFGNFFTIMEESLTEKLNRSTIKEIIASAETHGFIYVDEEILLDEPYTGCNEELKDLGSWWERYFEYM